MAAARGGTGSVQSTVVNSLPATMAINPTNGQPVDEGREAHGQSADQEWGPVEPKGDAETRHNKCGADAAQRRLAAASAAKHRSHPPRPRLFGRHLSSRFRLQSYS